MHHVMSQTLQSSLQENLLLQGQSLRWAVTPGHEYSLAGLPQEVLAAGDPALHDEVLRLLDWQEADTNEGSGLQTMES